MFQFPHASFRSSFIPLLVFLLIGVQTAIAEPVSWMERYALSQDREAMLAELIPGSEDYYLSLIHI